MIHFYFSLIFLKMNFEIKMNKKTKSNIEPNFNLGVSSKNDANFKGI